jgi:hypothetical protein
VADPRVEVEYIAPAAGTHTKETVTTPTYYNECEWRSYERVETGTTYHYIDDIDFGGEAGDGG